MRKRPLKLTSIAAEEPAETTMINRIASASPAVVEVVSQRPAPIALKRPTKHEPLNLVEGEVTFVSAVIKANDTFAKTIGKQASKANVSFDYATKFLAKKAVQEFRALDLEPDSKELLKTKSKLDRDIAVFLAKKRDGRLDWHRSRIVLSQSELHAVHNLCDDPLHVQTDTKCVNAVIHGILLRLRVPC